MGTLAPSGRIDVKTVKHEIEILRTHWNTGDYSEGNNASILYKHLSSKQIKNLDLFDKLQLDQILKVCNESRSLAEAGKKLFAVSRLKHKTINDSDRLRKYLSKFDLKFELL